MIQPRIEPPRRNYMFTMTTRDGKQLHKSLGIPHSPWASTPEERKAKAEANRLIAIATLNDLELAEHGLHFTWHKGHGAVHVRRNGQIIGFIWPCSIRAPEVIVSAKAQLWTKSKPQAAGSRRSYPMAKPYP